MPRKRKRLWDKNIDFPQIIEDLIEWGYGSGEELVEYLSANCKLGRDKAQQIYDLLEEANEAAHRLGWLPKSY